MQLTSFTVTALQNFFKEAEQADPMDLEIKAKWTRALRSGRYRQAQDHLKIDDPEEGIGHCCLGVLCEIVESPETIRYHGGYLFRGEGGYPHSEDLDAAKLESRVAQRLADLNDAGFSFAEIAELIDTVL